MYTEQQLTDCLNYMLETKKKVAELKKNIAKLKKNIAKLNEQMLVAHEDCISHRQRLLHMLEVNAKEEYGVQMYRLTELFIKSLNKTLNKFKGIERNKVAYFICDLEERIQKDNYGLSSDELVALFVITHTSFETTSAENADLYVLLRSTLLDTIFKETGTDLSDIAK